MIKINKVLQRPDKGTILTGSIVDYKPFFDGEKRTVRFNLTHWVSLTAKNAAKADGWKPIEGAKDFGYTQIRQCTDAEWADLDNAGSRALIEGWLKSIIESFVGAGKTEII